MPMNSALGARFNRLRMLWLALPLCLAPIGCGNSISPTNDNNTTAVTITVSAAPLTCSTSGFITLSAVVTNSDGSAFVPYKGALNFYANGVFLSSSATASAGPNDYSEAYTLVNEPCSSLPVQPGNNSISATTAADQYHSAGTSSNSVIVTVTSSTSGIPTTTSTPTATPAAISGNESTQLFATVTASSGSADPTGTIAFIDTSNSNATVGVAYLSAGNSTNCTSACSSGSTSVSASTLTTGSHKIVASYAPSSGADFAASTSASFVTVTVSNGSGGTAVSSTTLVANPTSITSSQTSTLTATVSAASGMTTPTGTVTFLDQTNGQSLVANLIAGTTAGTATATATVGGVNLASGTNTLIAEYSGDGSFAPSSSASVTITVSGTGATGIPTTVTVAPDTLSLAFGACGGVTITVAGPATGDSETPTGDVNISADGLPVGSPNMGGYDGSSNTGWTFCADNGTPLGASGTYSALFSYPGDDNYAASSATIPITVSGDDKASVTLDLSATSASTIPLGGCGSAQGTLVIDAEPNSDPPTGTVTFYVNGTTTVLGTGNVEQSAGATVANLNFCTTATQATGTYTVYGVYGGDSNYNASQLSNPVTFVITN